MKICITLLCFVLFAFLFPSSSFGQEDSLSVLSKIFQCVADNAEKQYGLNTIETGVASPDGILKKVSLEFRFNQQLSKQEFSRVLYDIATNLLTKINKNHQLRPCLDHYPFEYSDVSIVIFLTKGSDERFYYPDYCNVALENGYFVFQTKNPEKNGTIKLAK